MTSVFYENDIHPCSVYIVHIIIILSFPANHIVLDHLVVLWSMKRHFHWLLILSIQVCRSPCGSGCSGFLALLHHKGLIKEGEVRKFVNGKTRSVFSGKVVKQVKVSDSPAMITEISGKGYYTGECTFYCEQDDPRPSFLVK